MKSTLSAASLYSLYSGVVVVLSDHAPWLASSSIVISSSQRQHSAYKRLWRKIQKHCVDSSLTPMWIQYE